MTDSTPRDWGEASEAFDLVATRAGTLDLTSTNEAQTRFDVIDGMIRDVLGWEYGQIAVEEHKSGDKVGYVDYVLRSGDDRIIVEAKKVGATFPTPTRKKKLKLSGIVLANGEIRNAIDQAREYALNKDASLAVVTNGLCWCAFVPTADLDSYADLFFPFAEPLDAQRLFGVLSEDKVEGGILSLLAYRPSLAENRLLSVLHDADGRIDRNNIADAIVPALDNALYAEALLSNREALARCFVSTEARTRFDSQLGVHLADPRPESTKPSRRTRHHLAPP